MVKSVMVRRGYSLPLVLVVLTVLATTITVMTFVLAASAKSTGAILGRRDSLYACDGVARGLSIKARDYFQTEPTPTSATLRTFLCGAPGQCAPAATWIPGYTLDDVAVSTRGTNSIGEVSTGPFRGQSARRTDLTVTVTMTKTGSTQRCRVTQALVNSEIGLFQFAVFSSIYMDLFNGPAMEIEGRVHVNGDFCAHSITSSDLIIERVTASGRILTEQCPRAAEPNGSGDYFIRDIDGSPEVLNESDDGDESGWRAHALATWNGNAQDVSHGVPNLRLPVANGAQTQRGKDASGGALNNGGTLRLLVDPPRTADSPEARAEKLATQADIRIINGVWYKKAGAPFPGTPIWSDHPVSVSIIDSVEASLTGRSTLPASTDFPAARRYSHYELTGVGGEIAAPGGPPSVVSYGALKKSGATWGPGHIDPPLFPVLVAANDAGKVGEATRTGFVDFRVENGTPLGADHAHILPLNFDVGAFVAALNDPSNLELGSHFPGGSFNGIVWIANTSEGHLDGFPDGDAGPAPNVTPNFIGAETTSIPYPLCGGNPSNDLADVGANSVSQAGCSDGMPHVNAVRVFNAANVSAAVVPRGLTIASNGPVYVLGSVNTSSLTGSGVPAVPATALVPGPWVPVLVAGDAVTLLSDAWDDAAHLWNSLYVPLTFLCTANSVDTTYVLSVLAGHVETSAAQTGGGINNFPRFLECWNGIDTVIHGSLVIGYRSVYQTEPWNDDVYQAPIRLWHYDDNLSNPANQPPGSPSFFVQAIERWDRE
ncbi:MAG: hypothetical protein Q8O67_16360 [Deltaproteobacteria bacterium]|nr:hypothetical protein [Deltaproteobacteria bacterium]